MTTPIPDHAVPGHSTTTAALPGITEQQARWRVTSPDTTEGGPQPFLFRAHTLKVYAEPSVSPDTVQERFDVRHDLPSGEDLT